jgi:hypothetical protein
MRIAPEQDRRRYEPLGMTTALWQALRGDARAE